MKKIIFTVIAAAGIACYASPATAKAEDALIEDSRCSITVNKDGSRTAISEEKIKILTQTGRGEHADKSIFIDKTFSDFTLIKAGTFLKDGSFQEMEQAGINEVTPPALTNSLIYGDFISKILSFSSADPGNSIYFKYSMTKKNPEGYDSAVILLQEDTDIKHEEINISFPSDKGIKYRTNVKTEKKDSGIKAYADNVPSFKTENSRPASRDIGLYFAYSTAKDWNEAVKYLSDNIDSKIDSNSEIIKAKASELFKNAKTDDEKLLSALTFVNQKIRNIYLPLGTGGYMPRNASETLRSGMGDAKDKTVLFMALAKAGGIETKAALCNSSYSPIMQDVPTIKQFDALYPAVKRKDGKWGIFATGAQNSRTGYISTRKNAEMMLLGKNPATVSKIPYFDIEDSTYGTVNVKLNDDGSCSSSINVSAQGAFDASARKALLVMKGKQLDMFMDRSADSFSAGSKAVSYKTSDGDDFSKGISISLNIESPSFAVKQDRYLIASVTPPPFAMSYIPYDTSLSDREYPYVLGSCKKSEYKFTLQIPEGYKPAYIPESKVTKGAFGTLSLTSSYRPENNTIVFIRRLETITDKISPAEYKIFRKAVLYSAKQENKLLLLEKTNA